MQSKFWAKAADEESEESVVESSESEVESKPIVNAAAERWAAVDSSSSEEENRVMKSYEGKILDFYKNVGKHIEEEMTNNDFVELLKRYEGFAKFLVKKGIETLPNFAILYLDKLAKFVEEKYHENLKTKKLTKSKTQALNKLRVKIKKTSALYKEKLDLYNADPEAFKKEVEEEAEEEEEEEDEENDEGEEEEEEDKEDKEEKGTSSISKKNRFMISDEESENSDDEEKEAKKKKKEQDEKDDEEREKSDSEWSSYSGEEEDDSDVGDSKTKNAMSKWGLKTKDKFKEKKTTKTKKKKKELTLKGDKAGVEDIQSSSKSKVLFAELLSTKNLTEDSIRKRVQMVIEKRGRKGLDKHEHIQILSKLCDMAKTVSTQSYIEVLEHLINLEFDVVSSVYTYMSFSVWNKTFKYVEQILDILVENNNFYLVSINVAEEIIDEVLTEKDKIEKSCKTLISFLAKLDDELLKALLYIDVQTEEYRKRLGKTLQVIGLLYKGYNYVKHAKGMPELAIHISSRIVDHIYYKPETMVHQIWSYILLGRDKVELDSNPNSPSQNHVSKEKKCQNKEEKNEINPQAIIEEYVYEICQYGTKQQKLKAVLQLSYNKSLCDDLNGAKELLNIANVHELAATSDISTQILYNRNLIQLGLCAFRHGEIYEAHCCLGEICSQNKHKELIAQGVSNVKNQEKTAEQERAEKRRLLSHHMHISVDLIECVNNICAMLLEVPNLAKGVYEFKKLVISRQFRRLLDIYDKQIFNSPPENNREIIILATKYLQKGNWKTCCEKIFSLSIWSKIPEKEKVQELLKEKIKQEAMRTFIFRYLSVYDSFSIKQLADMFDLNENVIHSILSKMMINEEIPAFWNESSQYILINKFNPSPLQDLALKFSENINTVIEQNELALNMKNPKFMFLQERKTQMRDDKPLWMQKKFKNRNNAHYNKKNFRGKNIDKNF